MYQSHEPSAFPFWCNGARQRILSICYVSKLRQLSCDAAESRTQFCPHWSRVSILLWSFKLLLNASRWKEYSANHRGTCLTSVSVFANPAAASVARLNFLSLPSGQPYRQNVAKCRFCQLGGVGLSSRPTGTVLGLDCRNARRGYWRHNVICRRRKM